MPIGTVDVEMMYFRKGETVDAAFVVVVEMCLLFWAAESSNIFLRSLLTFSNGLQYIYIAKAIKCFSLR